MPESPVSPDARFDELVIELGDWRGETLRRVRDVILAADPGIVEEWKWAKPTNPGGVPVWSHGGIICTGESYRTRVKLTFAQGASLEDPAGLFTSSLEGKVRRGLDLNEGEEVDVAALTALVREAVAHNHNRHEG